MTSDDRGIRCAECGYSLRGTPDSVKCPECGYSTKLSLAAHDETVRSAAKGPLQSAITWLVLFPLIDGAWLIFAYSNRLFDAIFVTGVAGPLLFGIVVSLEVFDRASRAEKGRVAAVGGILWGEVILILLIHMMIWGSAMTR